MCAFLDDLFPIFNFRNLSPVNLIYSQVEDVLRFEMSEANQTLVYVLTLGVVESYRNFGIGQFLLFNIKHNHISLRERDGEKERGERGVRGKSAGCH